MLISSFFVADSDLWSGPESAHRIVKIGIKIGIPDKSVADPGSPVDSSLFIAPDTAAAQQRQCPGLYHSLHLPNPLPRSSRPLQALDKHTNQTTFHSQRQCTPLLRKHRCLRNHGVQPSGRSGRGEASGNRSNAPRESYAPERVRGASDESNGLGSLIRGGMAADETIVLCGPSRRLQSSLGAYRCTHGPAGVAGVLLGTGKSEAVYWIGTGDIEQGRPNDLIPCLFSGRVR